jgi:hypothetical protein
MLYRPRLRRGLYLVAAQEGGALLDTRARAGQAGCLAIGAPAGRYLHLRMTGEDHPTAARDVAHTYGADVDQVADDMARFLHELHRRDLLRDNSPGRRRWWGWWR